VRLYPNLPGELTSLLDPVNRGDYDSPLRWTRKGLTELAELLGRRGIRIGRQSVGRYLAELGYSLQANFRAAGPGLNAAPDEQLERINESAKEALARDEPIISLGSRKVDLDRQLAEAVPEEEEGEEEDRGTEEIEEDKGELPRPAWDLPEAGELGNADLALAAISAWWRGEGSRSRPRAERLLVVIDPVAGGGLGIAAWEKKIGGLAKSLDLAIEARFFPPASYKWNLSVRRLAGGVARDWRGRLRPDRETMVGLLGRAEPGKAIRL
jgi:hypothetical protein